MTLPRLLDHSGRSRHGGWRPDPRAHLVADRDLEFNEAHGLLFAGAKPQPIDLRSPRVPMLNQLELGSCVFNAGVVIVLALAIQLGFASPTLLSRLDWYLKARRQQGDVAHDTGSSFREAFDVLTRQGVVPESEWPYDVAKFADDPPEAVEADAQFHKLLEQGRVRRTIGQMRACLRQGLRFAIAVRLYSSFESAETLATGTVKMPGLFERELGGHGMNVCGDLPDQERFLVQNSWGDGVGDAGYFTMPYAYLLHLELAPELRVARKITDGAPQEIAASVAVPESAPALAGASA